MGVAVVSDSASPSVEAAVPVAASMSSSRERFTARSSWTLHGCDSCNCELRLTGSPVFPWGLGPRGRYVGDVGEGRDNMVSASTSTSLVVTVVVSVWISAPDDVDAAR